MVILPHKVPISTSSKRGKWNMLQSNKLLEIKLADQNPKYAIIFSIITARVSKFMEPKQKRQLERDQVSQKRRQEIIQAAKVVFDRMGIEDSKMTDVADEVEMGVATIYRYFNTKAELAIETGIDYVNEILDYFSPVNSREASGLKKVEKMIDRIIELYHEKPQFVRFLQSFDFYFSSSEKNHPRLADFESAILKLHPFLLDALVEGRKDGSIHTLESRDKDMAALIFRSLIDMEQRILTRDYVLELDQKMDRDFELQVLKEMILDYLTKKPTTENHLI